MDNNDDKKVQIGIPLKRRLGFISGVALIVGSIIGIIRKSRMFVGDKTAIYFL